MLLLAPSLRGDHLFGSGFSIADAYIYVMLRWARMTAPKRDRPCGSPCSTKG